MQIRISTNSVTVARDLLAAGKASQVAVQRVVAAQGIVLQTKVKARASGRPGPRVQTGDYRRSIQLQLGRLTAEVGTNAVQGNRLEFGFWGMIDSAGRLFHQPAYPHFGPAVDEMEQVFPAALEAAVGHAFGGLR